MRTARYRVVPSIGAISTRYYLKSIGNNRFRPYVARYRVVSTEEEKGEEEIEEEGEPGASKAATSPHSHGEKKPRRHRQGFAGKKVSD
ncbi:hypothetical protein BHM03_00059287 [Ensete ventricosum]|nr:hypothetical protein BHM03_00059287 [Ensete ventricosum]